MDSQRDATGDGPAAAPRWGPWESGATALLFSAPAVLLGVARASPGGRRCLDALDWVTVCCVLAAGFTLTLAARSFAGARIFLSIGLGVCCAWFFFGLTAMGAQGLAATYKPLGLVVLAAQYHVILIALVAAQLRPPAGLGEGPRWALRRRTWGVVASIVALDLTPLVYVLAPGDASGPAALVWMTASVVAGGAFAAVAAARLPAPAVGPACSAPPPTGAAAPGPSASGPPDRGGEGAP